MAEKLFVRGSEGSGRFIVDQLDKYGDIRIVPLDDDGALMRGSVIVWNQEFFPLIRDFWNRKRMKERNVSVTDVRTVNLTNRMVGTLGRRIAGLMREWNAGEDSFSDAYYRLDGILSTLSILGITYSDQMDDKEERYFSVTIEGQTFPVSDGTAEQETANNE